MLYWSALTVVACRPDRHRETWKMPSRGCEQIAFRQAKKTPTISGIQNLDGDGLTAPLVPDCADLGLLSLPTCRDEQTRSSVRGRHLRAQLVPGNV